MRTFETLVKAIQTLKEDGYIYDFNLHPDAIECKDLNRRLEPDEFNIDAVYRFEGMTNPDDSSVLYAISGKDGLKGLLVDAYGVYSESVNQAMIEKLTIDYKTRT